MFVISRLAPITPGTFSGGAPEGAGFTTNNPSTRRGEMLILDGTNMYQISV